MNATVVIHFWRINIEVSKNNDFRRIDGLRMLVKGAVGCSMFGLERHFGSSWSFSVVKDFVLRLLTRRK